MVNDRAVGSDWFCRRARSLASDLNPLDLREDERKSALIGRQRDGANKSLIILILCGEVPQGLPGVSWNVI
jgi:hypothetical protein